MNNRKVIYILILSDQKPGHYNQSLGVVERMDNCQYHVINVAYRGKSHDNLLRIATCIFGRYLLPKKIIRFCLKLTLSSKTLSEIASIQHTDAIISTGSSVATLNLLLGQLLNAQTVTCRHPSPVGTDLFDLAILPQTSWPKQKKPNLCQTTGGPNRISPEKLKEHAEILRRNINIFSSVTIGLLIGGGDRYHTICPQTITNLLYILRTLSQEFDLKILLATSRRTPSTINNLIAKDMLDTLVCPICVLADRQNKYTVTDIFSLSDLLIVTEDSFSMVCEAASSGRKLVILGVTRRISKSPKQDLVYSEMEQMEHIKWVQITEIKTTILSLLKQKMVIEPLRDSEIAANAVLQLLGRN